MNTYKLLDSGNGRRLEDYAGYIIDRPDPEAIWEMDNPEKWQSANAKYERSFEDKGRWITKKMPPQNWQVEIEGIKFGLKLTPFKHTGVFPEQSFQWQLISNSITQSNNLTAGRQGKSINILNLFGYTGGASLISAKAGASVTHVDASKPAITWFVENQKLNNLSDRPIRLIADDASKFVTREVKRGTKYDGVIMDPPVYGHGPRGEKWDFKKNFPELLENVSKILSPDPLFVIVNAYAVSTSSTSLENIMQDKFKKLKGKITSGELFLQESSTRKRILSTGIWAKWEKTV